MESSFGQDKPTNSRDPRLQEGACVHEEEIPASNGAPAEASLRSQVKLLLLSRDRSSASAAVSGAGPSEVNKDKEDESLSNAPLQTPHLAFSEHLFLSRDRSSASAAVSGTGPSELKKDKEEEFLSNDQRQPPFSKHLFLSRDRSSASAASSEAGPSEPNLPPSGSLRTSAAALSSSVADPTKAYMFKYDSTHGPFKGPIKVVDDSTLEINGMKMTFTSKRDPADIPSGNFGAEYVVESSRVFPMIEKASVQLKDGARKVMMSAPSADAPIFAVGVNERNYDPKMNAVSNASCSTNCLAPLAKAVQEEFDICEGLMTSTQQAVDVQEESSQQLPILEHLVLSRGRLSASTASSEARPSEVKKDKEEELPKQVVAEEANLPSDIILEILSHLPARSIYRFLLTSKAWHSVISSNKKLTQAFAGFFYKTYEFFREPRILLCFASICGQQIDSNLDFLPKDWECVLVDTCKGLLLCRCNKKLCSSDEFIYIACNPATRRWVELPPSPRSRKDAICIARLGFDPAVSPQFYVFELLDMAELQSISGVNIYSSEIASWIYCRSGWNQRVSLQIDSRSVFVNDRLYMVTQLSELVAVERKGETWSSFSDLSVEFIGLSQGYLHCVTASSDANVMVLCLDDHDRNTWVCKLHISKEQLYENSGEVWKIIGIHPDYDNLFLATLDDTKVGSYHMQLHRFQHIVDLDKDSQGHYFPYVPIFSEESPDLRCRL